MRYSKYSNTALVALLAFTFQSCAKVTLEVDTKLPEGKESPQQSRSIANKDKKVSGSSIYISEPPDGFAPYSTEVEFDEVFPPNELPGSIKTDRAKSNLKDKVSAPNVSNAPNAPEKSEAAPSNSVKKEVVELDEKTIAKHNLQIANVKSIWATGSGTVEFLGNDNKYVFEHSDGYLVFSLPDHSAITLNMPDSNKTLAWLGSNKKMAWYAMDNYRDGIARIGLASRFNIPKIATRAGEAMFNPDVIWAVAGMLPIPADAKKSGRIVFVTGASDLVFGYEFGDSSNLSGVNVYDSKGNLLGCSILSKPVRIKNKKTNEEMGRFFSAITFRSSTFKQPIDNNSATQANEQRIGSFEIKVELNGVSTEARTKVSPSLFTPEAAIKACNVKRIIILDEKLPRPALTKQEVSKFYEQLGLKEPETSDQLFQPSDPPTPQTQPSPH
jgi:hypothetical protein